MNSLLLDSISIVASDIKTEKKGTKLLDRMISSSEESGGGSFGNYYPISKAKGIKMLKHEFSSLQGAFDSYDYKDAVEECDLLYWAKKRYKNIPKCYGVKIIFIEEKYRIGIVLQHLDGPMGRNLEECDARLRDELKENLKKVGVVHIDLHSSNIILHNNDWWIIDFSPAYIRIMSQEELDKYNHPTLIRPTIDEFAREMTGAIAINWNPPPPYISEGMELPIQNKNPFVALNAEPWKLRRGRIAPKMLIK